MEAVKKNKRVITLLMALVFLMVCPFVLPVYWTMILTEILIMGLLAMSFNLLFGYTGLLSFGQAGFFRRGRLRHGVVSFQRGQFARPRTGGRTRRRGSNGSRHRFPLRAPG
jgi:ABC-type branched-subunit amino acid transport system permease subunit